MKFYSVLIFLPALVISALAGEWSLVWQDEFEGKELDFTKWAVEENGHGGGNNELQYYLDRKENVRVSQGCLVIEAKREKINVAGVERDYTSGKIRTKRRASWKYGRFEVRARLPKGQGIWPAVWMLPETDHYGGWAASGEIDIMESVGHEPNTIHGTIHHGGEWPNNKHTGTSFRLAKGDFSEDFHVFALEWEPGKMRWYVDGQLYQTLNEWESSNGSFPAPFDQHFHLIVNLAVGGKWPGDPNQTTKLPARLEIDYIRVYQQSR